MELDVNAELDVDTELTERARGGDLDEVKRLVQEHCPSVNKKNKYNKTALYYACENGHTEVAQYLLLNGASVHLGDIPLTVAVRNKHMSVVQLLLTHGAHPDTLHEGYEPTNRCTLPLHMAAAQGDCELVELLLEHGASVDVRDLGGNTPLHHAVEHHQPVATLSQFVAANGVKSVCDVLLENKADVNADDGSGRTPLYRAVSRVLLDIVRKMLEVYGGNPNIGLPMLPLAFLVHNMELVHMLLKHGANPNKRSESLKPRTLLHMAVSDSERVELLLKHGASIDAKDSAGNTALHHAVDLRNLRVCEILLENKADINAVNYSGQTPLCTAASRGRLDVDRNMLQKYGGNPRSPLSAECRTPNVEIVDMLLKHGADLNVSSRGRDSDLPLLVAAGNNNSEVAELLLRRGANIDVTDSDGNTALHRAIKSGFRSSRYSQEVAASNNSKSVINVLLEKKANVNIANGSGQTPLSAACHAQNVEIVDMLLKRGADPNLRAFCDVSSEHEFPLLVAANNDESKVVELLLKHGANINVTDKKGNTALHHAIKHQSPQYPHSLLASSDVKSVIDVLLENKADVNFLNHYGETPLCGAASRGFVDVVRKMLQVHGGKPNKGSPLVAACVAQNVEIVDMLLNHKPRADPNLQSRSHLGSKHKLPIFVAVDEGNSDIIMSLLNAGANVNAVNDEGKSVVCFAAEMLANTDDLYQSTQATQLFAIRQLLKHGAHFNTFMPDGRSPLSLIADALERPGICGDRRIAYFIELLQLMVKHGTMLLYSSSQLEDDISRQSFNSETLRALATFDGEHKFIVDLLRAGAAVQLIASFCNAVATTPRAAMSLCLCQAAVLLAGYTPSAEELQNLQLAAASDVVLDQLVNWLNEYRQQVPSLLRQCRVVIRRQLSAAVHYQTILPAIDKLPLPNDMKLYLQFDGRFSEVDLNEREVRDL